MLNVNSASRMIGGSGNTTIARTARTPTGTPIPVRRMSFIVGMAVVFVPVAIALVLRLVEFRIDFGWRRWLHAVAARRLQLVDVGEDLRHGDIQRCRDFSADLHALEQGARQGRRFE